MFVQVTLQVLISRNVLDGWKKINSKLFQSPKTL